MSRLDALAKYKRDVNVWVDECRKQIKLTGF